MPRMMMNVRMKSVGSGQFAVRRSTEALSSADCRLQSAYFLRYHRAPMSLLPTARVVFHTLRQEPADGPPRTWRSAAHRDRKLRGGADTRPFYEPLTGVG